MCDCASHEMQGGERRSPLPATEVRGHNKKGFRVGFDVWFDILKASRVGFLASDLRATFKAIKGKTKRHTTRIPMGIHQKSE